MRGKLTRTLVAGISGPVVVWDTEVRGLILRRRATGSCVYALRYRHRGRERTYTIGEHMAPWTPEAARSRARELLGDVARGVDPAEARDAGRAVPTLRELSERYLAEVTPRKGASTAEQDRRRWPRILAGLGAQRRVDAITRADVLRWHQGLGATPVVGNRLLGLLSHALNMAEAWGVRSGQNPCRHVKHYPEKGRERFLSAAELGRVAEALDGLEHRSPWGVAALRLLILTGARSAEILGLRWEQVDLEARRARLRESKTGPKTILLPEAAVEILRGLPRMAGPWVFPGVQGRHLESLWAVWDIARHVAGVPDVRVHDLRHSYASVAASLGVPLLGIGKLLGHARASTTERYAHLAQDPMLAVAERVGAKISEGMKKKG